MFSVLGAEDRGFPWDFVLNTLCGIRPSTLYKNRSLVKLAGQFYKSTCRKDFYLLRTEHWGHCTWTYCPVCRGLYFCYAFYSLTKVCSLYLSCLRKVNCCLPFQWFHYTQLQDDPILCELSFSSVKTCFSLLSWLVQSVTFVTLIMRNIKFVAQSQSAYPNITLGQEQILCPYFYHVSCF